MSTITADTIASVSLTEADRDPEGFAEKLGKSFEEYGFAIIADHGIPDALIRMMPRRPRPSSRCPEEVKRKYAIPGGGGARGYTPFGIETAKGAQAHDLKEFWHVVRASGRATASADHGRQCLAGRSAGFKETFPNSDTFDQAGLKILAIARHLGLKPDYFDATVENGN